jgi:hypothetical protein
MEKLLMGFSKGSNNKKITTKKNAPISQNVFLFIYSYVTLSNVILSVVEGVVEGRNS